jgi:hypothetical protein
MRDVGLALRAAKDHNQRLNKIRLQKFTYLMDAVSRLYELLPPTLRHRTYFYGPFDATVQNAVDCLAFRGFVRIVGIGPLKDRGELSVEYTLTVAGEQWISQLVVQPSIHQRFDVAQNIAVQLDVLGWERLRALVYAEPTFSRRGEGLGQPLEPDNGMKNSSAFLLQTMERVLQQGSESVTVARPLLVNVYFNYLTRYAKRVSASSTAERQ